jgi:hypothetical protein
MVRAILLIRLTLVLVGLSAAGVASGGGGATSDPGKKSTNSFSMITSAAAPTSRVVAPSAGVSLAPKAMVSNPYNVPLLQNAGSLRATR